MQLKERSISVTNTSGDSQSSLDQHSALSDIRFRRSYRLLHFIACRIFGEPEEAKKAVENCWHSASVRAPRCEYEGAFRSWLVRILIDEALLIPPEKPAKSRNRYIVRGGWSTLKLHKRCREQCLKVRLVFMPKRIAILGASGSVGGVLAPHILRAQLLEPADRLLLVGHGLLATERKLLKMRTDLIDAFGDQRVRVEVVPDLADVEADIVIVAAGIPVSPPSQPRRYLGSANPRFRTYCRSSRDPAPAGAVHRNQQPCRARRQNTFVCGTGSK
jgi:hypothetical protein